MNGIDNLLVPNTIVSIRAVLTVYEKVRASPCFVDTLFPFLFLSDLCMITEQLIPTSSVCIG